MAEGCLFCAIVNGDIPATIVRRDEHTVAFRDINPQAPTHVLVVPRKHIASVDVMESSDELVMGRLFHAAREIAREEGIAEQGYRLVVNVGEAAGQTVEHVHVHVLGGRHLKWPPG